MRGGGGSGDHGTEGGKWDGGWFALPFLEGGVEYCLGVCSDQEYLLPGGILGIPPANFVWPLTDSTPGRPYRCPPHN